MRGWLKNWENMRQNFVAVLGAGISGKGACSLLKQLGWESYTYDEQGRAFTKEEARACSFVICSPGFALDHPWRKIALNVGKKIISEIELASAFSDSDLTIITGTNGKTSLTTFLTHLWNCNQKKAISAGNVGVSFCDLVAKGMDKGKRVFLEMSSFQSADTNDLIADSLLWTNFDQDHIDYHGNLEKYFYSKAKMLDFVKNDKCFLGKSVSRYAKSLGLNLSGQNIVSRDEKDWDLPDHHFMRSYPQQENLSIAYQFSKKMGFNDQAFRLAVQSYIPEEHRLHFVKTVGESRFWNDSKSTNFSSALAACKNFKGNLFWIGGVRDKGGNIVDFVKNLKPLIKKAFLFGETGGQLYQLLKESGSTGILCKSLEQAVVYAHEHVVKKTNILFSPGFASFDLFDDYIHRGNSFIKYVLNLKMLSTTSRQVGGS